MRIAVYLFRAFDAVFDWSWKLVERFADFMAEAEYRARQARRAKESADAR